MEYGDIFMVGDEWKKWWLEDRKGPKILENHPAISSGCPDSGDKDPDCQLQRSSFEQWFWDDSGYDMVWFLPSNMLSGEKYGWLEHTLSFHWN